MTLESIATSKREISQQVSRVLSGISEANREFVNAHLETLRLEMEDLQAPGRDHPSSSCPARNT